MYLGPVVVYDYAALRRGGVSAFTWWLVVMALSIPVILVVAWIEENILLPRVYKKYLGDGR